MQRLLLLAAALVSIAAPAADFRLAALVSAGTSAQSSALEGTIQQVALYCDAAVRYRVCEKATCTAVATDAYVPSGAMFDIPVPAGYTRVAILRDAASGTATCQLYRVSPIAFIE